MRTVSACERSTGFATASDGRSARRGRTLIRQRLNRNSRAVSTAQNRSSSASRRLASVRRLRQQRRRTTPAPSPSARGTAPARNSRCDRLVVADLLRQPLRRRATSFAAQLVVERLAVVQVQRLADAGVLLPLARAGLRRAPAGRTRRGTATPPASPAAAAPACPAGSRRRRRRRRAAPTLQLRERRRHARHLRVGVEDHLAPTAGGPGSASRSGRRPRCPAPAVDERWYAAEFMIVRIRCLTSYLCLTKSFARASNSSALRRRVGLAQVVLGLDQPAAQEVPPDAVDQRLGEVRVVRRRQPVGEVLPAVGGAVERQRLAVERRRRHRRRRGAGAARRRSAATARCTSPARSPFFRPTRAEQVGHRPVLVLGPLLQRVVVAAAAGDRHAQERDRRRLGQVG